MADLVLWGSAVLALVGVLVFLGLKLDTESQESDAQSAGETVDEASDAASETSVSEGVKGAFVALAVLPFAIVTPLLTSLPPAWKLYHKMHLWSAWQMQKAANADVLANVRHPNGKEDVLPAGYVEGGEDDKDLSGYKVKGIAGKRYDPAVVGQASSRIGKADLIHINEDDPEQASWADCAIDTAFSLNREQYLFRDAQVGIQQMVVDATGGDQPAVADGGVEQQARTVDVSLERPGILEDVLVPLTSRAGYDGQLVSWNQHSNIKQEMANQESIREAKNAGWMAAKLDDIDGMDWLKVGLGVAVWSLILLFKDDLGAFISGIGGGDAVGSAASGAGLGMINVANYASMLVGVF